LWLSLESVQRYQGEIRQSIGICYWFIRPIRLQSAGECRGVLFTLCIFVFNAVGNSEVEREVGFDIPVVILKLEL